MKFILIAYGEALEDEVQEIIEKMSIEGYTQWTKVYGKGKASGPHLGSHIWPKVNNVIAIAIENDFFKAFVNRPLGKQLARKDRF